jgi:hypothetical protein
MNPEECRAKLKEQILQGMKEAFARYYAEFPDRILDQRSREAEEWSMRGINRIFAVIDQYDLTQRKKP